MASNEDAETWSTIFRYIKDLGNTPKILLADGATAITKAIEQTYGGETTRNMCYPHVYRNVTPQLKGISSYKKEVSNEILSDIEMMQWSAMNIDSFFHIYELLEEKYKNKFDQGLNSAIAKFFEYMRKVWIESKENRWFEGAHPWNVCNNQGVEGKNKAIKQSHTFRRRLDMGELFNVLLNMVKEFSEEDQTLLSEKRSSILFNRSDSLKLKTEGYQWYKSNKNKAGRIMRIKPGSKYSVNNVINNFWAVASSRYTGNESLKDLAKLRFENRRLPQSQTFEEYTKMRSSCWILEEVEGEFFCDCPIGMKGKLCKHTVGMMFKTEVLAVTSEVRSVPLGEKRKRGRPKKLNHCLQKSPVRASVEKRNDNVVVDSETSEDEAIEPVQNEAVALVENESFLPENNLKRKRVDNGLGASKPPKKKARLPVEIPSDNRSLKERVCKKKKGSCSHKIVFGKHYDVKEWEVFEKQVRIAKPITEVVSDCSS